MIYETVETVWALLALFFAGGLATGAMLGCGLATERRRPARPYRPYRRGEG